MGHFVSSPREREKEIEKIVEDMKERDRGERKMNKSEETEEIKQESQDGPVSLTWLPDKFQSIGLLVLKKKFNIDFQDGGHLGFPIRTIFATFDLQVNSILPKKFE